MKANILFNQMTRQKILSTYEFRIKLPWNLYNYLILFEKYRSNIFGKSGPGGDQRGDASHSSKFIIKYSTDQPRWNQMI